MNIDLKILDLREPIALNEKNVGESRLKIALTI
jgi:hypothetical protein